MDGLYNILFSVCSIVCETVSVGPQNIRILISLRFVLSLFNFFFSSCPALLPARTSRWLEVYSHFSTRLEMILAHVIKCHYRYICKPIIQPVLLERCFCFSTVDQNRSVGPTHSSRQLPCKLCSQLIDLQIEILITNDLKSIFKFYAFFVCVKN